MGFNVELCYVFLTDEEQEKVKQQQIEATRRENVLVMRLTTKEQEMQEYMVNTQYVLLYRENWPRVKSKDFFIDGTAPLWDSLLISSVFSLSNELYYMYGVHRPCKTV